MTDQAESKSSVLIVSSSPHLSEPATSRRVMIEVCIGCIPAAIVGFIMFKMAVLILLVSCIASGLITEYLFNMARKKVQTISDGSVVVTAIILALSLPPAFPWWAAVIGMVIAVAIGKMVFGGLGHNIFNPAMVGRAFLMACFGMMMTTWTVPDVKGFDQDIQAVTGQTPLALAKQPIKDAANVDKPVQEKTTAHPANELLQEVLLGKSMGSVGETSALAWLIGGLFLLWRGTITWHIPIGVLGSSLVIALIAWLSNSEIYVNPLIHLFGGGMMMCAFFIATDPVSCPLPRLGRLIFGIGVGTLIMLIRLKGGYPEGVMYAILLMNSVSPLIGRWTRPAPFGGRPNR